ncbi:MAG: methylenetetrahydrofolate reductase C-terminal domain-containing protein [Woeseia sp.]
MYRMRKWSVRNARWLSQIYSGIESVLVKAHPLLKRIGYDRLDKPFVAFEKVTKGFLLDSQSCGQCIVGSTGLSCPMNCPKTLRNGPCGGVRPDGTCEIEPDMPCVWVLAWEGNKRMACPEYPIQIVQPPVDNRLKGTSAWLREVRLKANRNEI